MNISLSVSVTYGHRRLKTRDPVRSPIDKQAIARLVLGWVTTGESLVLYVFSSLPNFAFCALCFTIFKGQHHHLSLA
ncbi:hypothetical protein NKR19_g2479 [Coniochaeta hoffmannii]|uniref:Uncharacterized protein n=1 Tax=Coniochaeta hoffmannii TaxID=91930 RepID=A0AA38RYW2_9PEZI|nr:hypothetical protein NKR19_g2479 [Coniochaeta hoffmannii]